MQKFVKIEMDTQAENMEAIVHVRQDLRMANAFAGPGSATVTPQQAFKLACVALAVIGEKDELDPRRTSAGEWVTVGPHIGDAVRYVLKRDAAGWTHLDYDRTMQHALLMIAACRGC